MKVFWNIIKHKYLKVAAIIGILLFLPLILFASYQTQELRGRAEAATTLSIQPSSSKGSPIVKGIGDNFYLDVMVNPGKNIISILKVDIRYDPSIISLSETNPLIVNDIVFPQVLEGPVYSNGRVQIVISTGPNLSNTLSTLNRALTLNFVANSPTNRTNVEFGDNTSVSSVAVNDGIGENVLSSTSPAYIKIGSSKENRGSSINEGGNNKGSEKKPK